jgi:hypothetical protein
MAMNYCFTYLVGFLGQEVRLFQGLFLVGNKVIPPVL